MEVQSFIKSFNRLENYVIKYIYKKYIETHSTPDQELNHDLEHEQEDESQEESEEEQDQEPDQDQEQDQYLIEEFKYSKKPINNTEYRKYLNKILAKQRKKIITQRELLTLDIQKLNLANTKYNESSSSGTRTKKKVSSGESLPDSKRCTYIRKNKNKLIRCSLIANDETETYCIFHIDKPNMYLEAYQELIRKL